MSEPQKFAVILFQLPNGEVVLQRRTEDAPFAPGKLGIFGGWVEEGESPGECIIREIEEETSLSIDKLEPQLLRDFIVPASEDFDKDRHFFLYSVPLLDLDFEVYEGQGAEAFSLDELKARDDLTGSASFTFQQIL